MSANLSSSGDAILDATNTGPADSSTFHYPAETCRHIATILGFPSKCTLPPKHYQNACWEIVELAATISEFEPVRLYASLDNVSLVQTMVESKACGSFGVKVIPLATNHLWVRDTAPVYVHGQASGSVKQRYALGFNFNEWGGTVMDNDGVDPADKWPAMEEDRLKENITFARCLVQADSDPSPVTLVESKLCLEGGALVYDGDGTLIISESSILGDDRNPGLSKEEVEGELRRQLGATKIIWFPGFKNLDVTDVHADAEVQFIRPGVLVLSQPHASAPQQWLEVYEQLRGVLRQARDAKGRQFDIHTIAEPDPKVTEHSRHEDPATNYVNFYFVNGGVILPKFGDGQADREALETLQRLCPDRVVKQVHVNALPLCGGVIHCATQPVVDVCAS